MLFKTFIPDKGTMVLLLYYINYIIILIIIHIIYMFIFIFYICQ